MDAIGVEYMVTGSMALNFYALPRTTRDIDIVVDVAPADRRFLIKVLVEDFEADADVIRDALQRNEIFNVLTPSFVKIDVISRDRQMDHERVFQRRNTFTLRDQQVKVISPEDLVLAKLYWARESKSEMQFRDIRNLLAGADIDREYILKRARELGLVGVWREVNEP